MKNKKWVLFIIGVLITLNVSFFVYQMFLRTDNTPKKETKILDTIANYNYKLEDRDSTLYKDEFKALKTNLTSDSINDEDYAKSIAKLYIIDLYTINNKLNKYDVGSQEFIYSKSLENYVLKVQDTLYKYVEDNTYNQRDQVLPIVKTINVTDLTNSTYILAKTTYDSYEVTLDWTYEEENDYDKTAKIILIKEGIKLVVVEEDRVE